MSNEKVVRQIATIRKIVLTEDISRTHNDEYGARNLIIKKIKEGMGFGRTAVNSMSVAKNVNSLCVGISRQGRIGRKKNLELSY